MNVKSVLKEMESLGTAQNRKIYSRHGVNREMFGLSYASQKKLAKTYKKEHALSLELWQSGNHDARILACMIADPGRMDERLLNVWAAELDNYVITDAFSGMAVKAPDALSLMHKWTQSKEEWIAAAGWNMLAHMAMKNKELDDGFFQPYLEAIKNDIHKCKNRVRYSMNNVLIAIGVRNEELQQKAMDVAKKIGAVQVDHGETGCKTPDAHDYILKTVKYKQNR